MTYFVTVQYGTRAGNVGAWAGLINAPDHDTALTRAVERIRRRRYVARIFGGDVK